MKTNAKKFSILLIIGLIFAFQFSCKKDTKNDPKVSVNLTIDPLTIASGGTTHFTLTITNLGEAIVVTRINIKDECISGWAKGQKIEDDLPAPYTNISLDANETISILDQNIGPLSNPGINSVSIKETITAYYEGGSASKSITYIITNASKKSEGSISIHSIGNLLLNK